jgi:hypothetical protein
MSTNDDIGGLDHFWICVGPHRSKAAEIRQKAMIQLIRVLVAEEGLEPPTHGL